MTFQDTLAEKLGADMIQRSEFRDNHRVIVSPEKVYVALECCQQQCGFDMLMDITGVDYLEYPGARHRFGVIYCLLNTSSGERGYLKTHLDEPELVLPSVYPLWKGADWMEREIYDMYGITFTGHPDLRRILLPEEFTAYPLRKDYPLRGRGERHNFPVITRDKS